MLDNDSLLKQRYNLLLLAPEFREYLVSGKNLSHISIKNYLSDFRFFAGWFNTHHQKSDDSFPCPLDYINEDCLNDYRSFLSTSPLKSANRRLSTLRAFCDFALRAGLMSSDPTERLTNIGTQPRVAKPEGFELFEAYLIDTGLDSVQIQAVRGNIDEFMLLAHA